MGLFLSAAYKVLKAVGSPLTAMEVTERALAAGFLASSGQTPHQTMKSKISSDILKKKKNSLFKRTEPGKFGLREWSSEAEYTAQRHVKAVFDEDILVFDQKYLSRFIEQDGFTASSSLEDVTRRLSSIIFTTRRRQAENNDSLIQLISVFVVRHQDYILTHKRTKRLPESRLHNYYSAIFGGHLTKDDFMPLLGVIDVKREMAEELRLKSCPVLNFIGLIYDSSKEVSRIHLGLVFDVVVTDKDFEIGERGYLTDAKFEKVTEVKHRIQDFENWSQILLRVENFDIHQVSNREYPS